MNPSQLLGSHPFPLIRGGGLFVLIIGLSMIVGAVVRWRLWVPFIGGVIVASVSVMITAVRLSAPLGRPTVIQIESLVLAVLIEMVTIMWLSRRLRVADERGRNLSILAVVGAHFFVMAPAFGPLIVLLGVSSLVNAAAGLRAGAISWLTFWFIDGTLKAGIGGAMFLCAPRITW